MKIVPLTLLKDGATAKIVEVVKMSDSAYSKKLHKHIATVGFYPGKEVQMVRQFGEVYSVRAGNDNPFAMSKKIVETIHVNAEDVDVYISEKASKEAHSLRTQVKKLLDFIENKFKKH